MLYATAQTRGTFTASAAKTAEYLLGHAYIMPLVNVNRSIGTGGYLQNFMLAPLSNQQTSADATNTDFLFHTPGD